MRTLHRQGKEIAEDHLNNGHTIFLVGAGFLRVVLSVEVARQLHEAKTGS